MSRARTKACSCRGALYSSYFKSQVLSGYKQSGPAGPGAGEFRLEAAIRPWFNTGVNRLSNLWSSPVRVTRFGCVHFLLLLFLTLSAKAQTQQSDDPALVAARELAIAHFKTVNIVGEHFFASFSPHPAEVAHFMFGHFQEIYTEVAIPIFARRLAAEEMRLLTQEFNRPVYQTFMVALGEAMMVWKPWKPCTSLEMDALPKPQELRRAEHQRLARQLWQLLADGYAAPSESGAEPNQPQPRLPKKLQEDFDRSHEDMTYNRFTFPWPITRMGKRMNCQDDGAVAVLAEHLTIEDLKALISLEQSQPMQKLNTALDEVHWQLALKAVEDAQKKSRQR